MRYLVSLGLLLIFLAIPALALQQNPLGLQEVPVVEPLIAELWMDKGSYGEGETAQIMFSVNQPSYVYILNIRSDGIVRMIFPNAYSQGNFVSAGIHSLPDGLYEFRITAPTGTDHLQIVAALQPLQLPVPSPDDPYPMLGADPNSALSIVEEQIQGIVTDPSCTLPWATAWCSFNIIAPAQPPCSCQPPTTYTPPATYSPPVYTPPTTYCPPAYTPPTTYCPPAYTPPTTYCPPAYMPPTTYCPPAYTPPTYSYYYPPVTAYCPPAPCPLPFFGGIFRIGFRFVIGSSD
jgi:uncharacterized protein DUF4384